MLKIVLEKAQKLWITSDTHYGHKNICKGVTEWDLDRIDNSTTRDFKTLEEMNETIVNNINAVVGQDDILIHLGDWSFGGFDNIRVFRNRLVCKTIHLVTGNHDHHIVNDRDGVRSEFASVHEYYSQLEVRVPRPNGEVERMRFVLCHFPVASWHDMNDGIAHLFGHVHLPPNKKIMQGRAMDVGMDGNDMKPYSIFDCVKLLQNRPVLPVVLPLDHHVERVIKGEKSGEYGRN
jgi:calcineurin-like phosphoesterase family protein